MKTIIELAGIVWMLLTDKEAREQWNYDHGYGER